MYTDYGIAVVICGLVSALIARHRGRNQYAWFFAGAIGSVFAILVIAFLKNKVAGKVKK